MCELYQFISDYITVNLEILFEGSVRPFSAIEIEGIKFQPSMKEEDKDEKQPISDSDANWEEKLPSDYEDIVKWSKNSLQWTIKEEVYLIIRKGFLISYDKKRSIWFSLDENGKKCHMMSARLACQGCLIYCLSLPESRFGEAV